MFQYALGRTLAHRRRTSLALDVSSYPDEKLRYYSLGAFKIAERFARRGGCGSSWLYDLSSRFGLAGKSAVLLEKSFTFDPAVPNAPGNVYVDGYWQSEKYFIEIQDIIRREFGFKNEPDAANAELVRRILGVNAVSVHVRRGDFANDPATHQMHGTCSPEYYREAARLIDCRAPNPSFFVFSDDPDWARANLEFPASTTFIAHNGPEKGHEDLRLMTLCRHHITANSSFSWWGAWLGNIDGIVVAPREWVRTSGLDTRDLVPNRWLRL